jgi:Na+/proline symporter
MNTLAVALSLFSILSLLTLINLKRSHTSTKEGFMVSNRNASWWLVMCSIASSWLWVVGLILGPRFAYESGPAMVFWTYGLPFIAPVILFGYLGKKLLEKFPKGFTLNSYIDERYGNKKLTVLYRVLQILACVYALSATLTGFGLIADFLSPGFNSNTIVYVIATMVLIYSLLGGQKASHRTDFINFAVLSVATVGFAMWIMFQYGGTAVMENWLAATNVAFLDTDVIINKGLFLLIIFTGGIMTDNLQYQNAFAIGDSRKVMKTYTYAAISMAIMIFSLAFVAGSLHTVNPAHGTSSLPAFETAGLVLGGGGLLWFALAILFKASSVIDSSLNGVGAVVANDILLKKNPVTVSRLAMAFVLIASVLIAVMKIDLWILVTTFGLLRVVTVVPTIYALLSDRKIKSESIFYCLLIVVCVGVFLNYFAPIDKVLISLLALGLPGALVWYEHKKAK